MTSMKIMPTAELQQVRRDRQPLLRQVREWEAAEDDSRPALG